MKNFQEFMNEKLDKEKLVQSSALLDDLRDQFEGGLDDWTNFLNDVVMKDKKAKAAFFDLYDAFANDHFKVRKGAVKVSDCLPTQSEIFASNSLAFPCGACIEKADVSIEKQWSAYKEDEVTVGKPGSLIVVYQKKGDDKYYIIDGHHRWSQLACIHPDAKIKAAILTADIDAKDVLKVSQTVIAEKENGDKIPAASSDAADKSKDNIYNDACTKDIIMDFCKKTAEKNKCEDDLVNAMKEAYGDDKIEKLEDGLEILADNAKKLPKPDDQAVERVYMPQTDKVNGGETKGIIDAIGKAEIPSKDVLEGGEDKDEKKDKNESHILSYDEFVNENYRR